MHREAIRFGAEGERGVARAADGRLELVEVADVGEESLVRHDAHRADPGLAFELAHLSSQPTGPTPVGVFRSVERGVYAEELQAELMENKSKAGVEDLRALLHAGDVWTVS